MTESPTNERMVEVFLSSIVTRRTSQQQLIKLKEKGGERSFPIVIGLPEAAEIRRVVKEQRTERPMTHELLVNTIEALGSKIMRVDIIDLRNHTFFAQLILEGTDGQQNGEQSTVVDARPSDAIALALRGGVPLRVAESILAEVRTDDADDPLEAEDEADEDDESKSESDDE